MKILRNKLTEEMKKTIYDGFKEHAIEKCGTSELEDPINFYIEGPEKNVISAIVCQIFWGALHIKYVWTHKEHRGKGYASKLMYEVFNFSKESECPFAYVETMNFQAPDFYEKFGFVTELVRDGYSKGTSFYYMRKDFNNITLKLKSSCKKS
jgi:ribosomal protein S18 acetylase RimI-like enzyme